MTGNVAGVLLAAGTSSRMGRNKLLERLGGVTLLRRAARTALAAGLDPLLVVLGYEAERARMELEGLPCTVVVNPRYAEGMNTSLVAGIAALPPVPEGAVVMLADMPFVTPVMVRTLIERWNGEPLAVSLFGDVVAPPTLYSRALFAEVLALPPDACGKQVVKQHRKEALEVPQPESGLRDLDLPADLLRARSELEGG